jgi:hypothetical protein
MRKGVRLLVAGSLLAGSTMILTAGPAQACFNPDEPMCKINRAFCNATEPVAKYRDKVTICYP